MQMLDYIITSPIWEYLLAICISCYGLNTVFSFVFSVPKSERQDPALVPYSPQNYVFWLLTSVIFFLYGVFLLTNVWLVGLMLLELTALTIIFVWFL